MISPLNAKLDRKWIEASQRIATLEQQVAELVAALESLLPTVDWSEAKIIEAALSKVKQP